MSILGRFTKQPAEKESYSINYVDDLVGADALAIVDTVIEPFGLDIIYSIIVGTRVKTFIGGGAVGVKYKATVTVTTDDGRIFQDEFFVTIRDY